MIDLSAVGQGRRYEDCQDLSSVTDGQRALPREIPYTEACSSSPENRVGRWLFAGFMLLLAALALTFVAAGEGTVPGDIAVARAIQQPPSSALDTAARVLSDIGDTMPMVLLAATGVALLVHRGRRDLALVLALAAGLRALGPVLKTLFNSPRPTPEAVVIVAHADGFGFPSGHALGAALFWGAIAVIVPQVVANQPLARVFQVMAVGMMVLIAWSRVRLGVHWPSDVAGGVLYGLGFVCLVQAAFLSRRLRVRS
jgi:undecaprenyl-diphosphatase